MAAKTCTGYLLLSTLIVVTSLVSAQEEPINVLQETEQEPSSPIDRILKNYVYPLRDIDWQEAILGYVRSFLDYFAPETKEPRLGEPLTERQGSEMAHLASRLLRLAIRSFLPRYAASSNHHNY
ncbi:uncharacterized protein LOC143017603 [Oratosquilla oratoria]|uniref:uncharacterized protein LOC143017603 n=1 Tax=Oratosquilla oratoria TaxID=337810 RepID=UPI003F760952